jgi:hypothetical protein
MTANIRNLAAQLSMAVFVFVVTILSQAPIGGGGGI